MKLKLAKCSKALGFALLVAALCVGLPGGCGKRASHSSTRTTIRMAIWSGGVYDYYADFARRYELLQSRWRVVVELQSGQAYDTWMKIQMIGGTCPEVMNCQWHDAWRYGRLNRLLDLRPFLEEPDRYAGGVRWRDTYFEVRYKSALDPLGRLFIVPVDQVKTALFLNESLLAKLGLKTPTTWAQYLQVCQKVKEAGYIPVAVANSQAGGDATVGWTKDSLFDNAIRPLIPKLDVLEVDGRVNPEECIRGVVLGIVDFRADWAKAPWALLKDWSRYWQKGFNAATVQDTQRLFYTGKTAMVTGGCWSVRDYRKRIVELGETGAYEPFDLSILPLPYITAETNPVFAPPLASVGTIGSGFVVPAGLTPEKQAGAIDWLRYITSPPVIEAMSAELNLPAVKGTRLHPCYAGWEPLLDGTFPDLSLTEGCIVLDSEMNDEWNMRFQAYLDDRLTLDQYVDDFSAMYRRAIDRMIARYGYNVEKWKQM